MKPGKWPELLRDGVQVMSVGEIEERYGLSKAFLLRMERDGALRRWPLAQVWLYAADDVKSLLARRRPSGLPPVYSKTVYCRMTGDVHMALKREARALGLTLTALIARKLSQKGEGECPESLRKTPGSPASAPSAGRRSRRATSITRRRRDTGQR